MSDNAESAKSFLSHNSRDKPAVEVIQGLLERGDLQRGERPIPCWFDNDDLRSTGTWISQLEKVIKTCEAAVFFLGPNGLGPVHDEEKALLLSRAFYDKSFRLVSVLLPGAQQSDVEGFIANRMWADFRKGLDDAAALQRLRAFILGEAPKSGPGGDPKVPKPEIEPYRGLEPFEGKHAIYFFGRDNEIKELCGRLREWPFTAVIGGSGSGKSSIVRAGLQTELATQERPALAHTTTITVRPGSNPIRALADQVAASLPEPSVTVADRLKLVEDFDQQFRTGSDKLLNMLRSLYPKDDQHILLVIDQFEELFTHSTETQTVKREGEAPAEPRTANGRLPEPSPPGSPTSDSQQTQFVELLAAVAKSQLDRLRIVITLRADFFDRCLSVPTLKSLIENRTLLLGKLSDDALRTVIEAPAFKVGAYFEKGLVARILKDVENQNGSLPLLQHALKELWEQRRFGFLTDDAYDLTGGVEGALKKRANATLQNLSEDQREIAKNIFLRLTTLGEGVSDTRRRVRKTELYPEKTNPHVIDEVLKGLSSQATRLIVTNDDGTVEVTHEALIQRWDTLKGWLAENRDDKRLHDRLRDAANEWIATSPKDVNRRDSSYLWDGDRLDLAEKLDQSHPNLLTAFERKFVTACRQKARRAWVSRNLTLEEWHEFVGTDLPYEKTCPNLPTHPTVIDAITKLLKTADMDSALAVITPTLQLEVRPHVAEQLREEIREELHRWKLPNHMNTEADREKQCNPNTYIPRLSLALQLDTALQYDAIEEANRLCAETLLERARSTISSSENSSIPESLRLIRRAQELLPTITAVSSEKQVASHLLEFALRDAKGFGFPAFNLIEFPKITKSIHEAAELDPAINENAQLQTAKQLRVEAHARDSVFWLNRMTIDSMESASRDLENAFQLSDTSPAASEKDENWSGLLIFANRMAKEGKLDETIQAFSKAKASNDQIQFDAEKTGQLAVAMHRLNLAKQEIVEGDIDKSIERFRSIEMQFPEILLHQVHWNYLCWFGCLRGRAKDVLFAGERATELEQKGHTEPYVSYGLSLHDYRDTRGVAYALTGNFQGAIDDFQSFIDNTKEQEKREQRSRWVEMLKSNQQPLTKEVLSELLKR